jgi:hypothetical protein
VTYFETNRALDQVVRAKEGVRDENARKIEMLKGLISKKNEEAKEGETQFSSIDPQTEQ